MATIYCTAREVISAIAAAIEGSGEVNAAADEFDLGAISADCFSYRTFPGEAQRNGYEQTANGEEFWASIQRHAI